jgi:uncharacterized protein (DUF1501 family)
MIENAPSPQFPATRREFLVRSARAVSLLAFSRFAPSFLVDSALAGAPVPEKDRRVLVLVQLAGGNDGLNTVVPFGDENYYRLRPTLGIPATQALPIGDGLGLHPACAAMRRLLGDGKLAVVQDVGYPNPNRSHFRSMEIWETASDSESFLATGWVGRYLDNACPGAPGSRDPEAVHANTLNGEPETLVGAAEHPTFGLATYGGGSRDGADTRRLLEGMAGSAGASGPEDGFLKQVLMDSLVAEEKVQRVLAANRPDATYPAHPFAASLRNVCALIAAGLPTRVYFATLNGFDTHTGQLATHARLLQVLSESLAAFQKDLEARKLDAQVVTMTFSEFGRRASENQSHGTDHGTASPLFVLGSSVKAGLHGSAPSLKIPRNQDVVFGTDFRSVYATMLEDWLECPSEPVLGRRFGKLPLIA